MLGYVVCYDVSDDKVRERIAQVLLRVGHRVQFSVFEVMLRNEAELQRLCGELQQVADAETKVRLYRVCGQCRKASRSLQGEALMCLPSVIIV